jgi:hypothetical protein
MPNLPFSLVFVYLRAIDEGAINHDRTSATNTHVEDDEEWGWGDDDKQNIEMTAKPTKPSIPPFRPKTPPGQSKRLTFRARSGDSNDPELQATANSIHALPKNRLNGSPLSQNSNNINSDDRVSSPIQMSALVQVTAPAPPVPSLAVQPPALMSGGLAIQSLGPSVVKTPVKAAFKPPEDDIFAEFGLSAAPAVKKPSSAKAASIASRPTNATASMWNSKPTTSLQPPPRVAPTPVPLPIATQGSDDFDKWDDDGDLDDLLDE